MREPTITHAIVDVDGVLRREKKQLPGVPELFECFVRSDIQNVILSNNSRKTSDGIANMMQQFGVEGFEQKQAMTSAEAAAEFFHQRARSSDGDDRIFAIGEEGLKTALQRLNIPTVNRYWDGERWEDSAAPTHVISGFKDSNLDYERELAPAWNALYEGAELIVTNADVSYRNAAGSKVPANGAQAHYFKDVAPHPKVLGKPHIGMAEVSLKRFGADKESAKIAVIDDTLEQGAQLAANLQEVGWDAESWIVLTGDTARKEAEADDRVQKIFADIIAVREHITLHFL